MADEKKNDTKITTTGTVTVDLPPDFVKAVKKQAYEPTEFKVPAAAWFTLGVFGALGFVRLVLDILGRSASLGIQ